MFTAGASGIHQFSHRCSERTGIGRRDSLLQIVLIVTQDSCEWKLIDYHPCSDKEVAKKGMRRGYVVDNGDVEMREKVDCVEVGVDANMLLGVENRPKSLKSSSKSRLV